MGVATTLKPARRTHPDLSLQLQTFIVKSQRRTGLTRTVFLAMNWHSNRYASRHLAMIVSSFDHFSQNCMLTMVVKHGCHRGWGHCHGSALERLPHTVLV
eukprot:958625-Amphidinium_carterae.1